MSGPDDADIVLDVDADDAEYAPEQVEPVVSNPPPTGAPAGSIIGSLDAEVVEVERSSHKDLRVGKIPSLWCRYRVLLREEREAIERAAKHRKTLRSKVSRNGADDDGTDEEIRAAQLLISACVELMWPADETLARRLDVEIGELVPLAEALRAEGAVGDVPDVLEYNAEMVQLLGLGRRLRLNLDGDRPPSAVQIVTALHRWGGDVMPLLTNARLLSTWMSAVTADALEGVIEGM